MEKAMKNILKNGLVLFFLFLSMQSSFCEQKVLKELSEENATPLELEIASSMVGKSNLVFVSSTLMTDRKIKDVILDYKTCTVQRTTYGLTGAVLKEEKLQIDPKLFWGRIKGLSLYFTLYGELPVLPEIDCDVLKVLIEKGLKELS